MQFAVWNPPIFPKFRMSDIAHHCSDDGSNGEPQDYLLQAPHDDVDGMSERESDNHGQSIDEADTESYYSAASIKTTKSLPDAARSVNDYGDVSRRNQAFFEQAKSLKMLQERYQEQERALHDRDKFIEYLGERAITYKKKLLAYAERYAVGKERARLLEERVERRDKKIRKLEEELSGLRNGSLGKESPTALKKRDMTRRYTLPGRLQNIKLGGD
ncbi:hypothetical protein HDK77DRAFT_252880 [Phyllosticta capitalensis]